MLPLGYINEMPLHGYTRAATDGGIRCAPGKLLPPGWHWPTGNTVALHKGRCCPTRSLHSATLALACSELGASLGGVLAEALGCCADLSPS